MTHAFSLGTGLRLPDMLPMSLAASPVTMSRGGSDMSTPCHLPTVCGREREGVETQHRDSGGAAGWLGPVQPPSDSYTRDLSVSLTFY